jgi:hypothetical protein
MVWSWGASLADTRAGSRAKTGRDGILMLVYQFLLLQGLLAVLCVRRVKQPAHKEQPTRHKAMSSTQDQIYRL